MVHISCDFTNNIPSANNTKPLHFVGQYFKYQLCTIMHTSILELICEIRLVYLMPYIISLSYNASINVSPHFRPELHGAGHLI